MPIRRVALFLAAALLVAVPAAAPARAQDAPRNSPATEECLGCHAALHPGIVEGWKKSRHARRTPAQALAEPALKRRVSAEKVPDALAGTTVGCAECHLLRPDKHADTFEHNGYRTHLVVSPDDCATCHPQERQEYAQNIMAQAHGNLVKNPVFMDLVRTTSGAPRLGQKGVEITPPDPATDAEACLSCHGTALSLAGRQTRDTDYGAMDFPVIRGWPSAGTGRVNLDGSLGSCSACHTRHEFSIETARKPHTCKQCHVGPDVPVAKIYEASRHGKIYDSRAKYWNFDNVPWTVGQDFTAPTCASCHVSLLVDPDGQVLARRSHRMNDRLPWRMFGLVYGHAHPASPDTSIIRNKDGQPLPTALDGTPAAGFLIDPAEQAKRRDVLLKPCLACHGTSWVAEFWQRFENTMRTTNQATAVVTTLMQDAWKTGLADPASLFDEFPEKIWSDTWLFYANSTRMASAMGCGGDYGVFADGRYQLMRNIAELQDWLKNRKAKP